MKLTVYGWAVTLCVLMGMCFSGCSEFNNLVDKPLETNGKKNWVYAEIMVTTTGDTTTYYQYGTVHSEILKRIEANPDATGLFSLSKIRYWNTDDLLTPNEDDAETDTYFFRIEDIRHMEVLKADPVFTLDEDQLGEACLAIKRSKEIN